MSTTTAVSASTVNFPPSEQHAYDNAMQALINAMEKFQGATDPTQKALFAAQVQNAMLAVSQTYNDMATDGNPSDEAFAQTSAVQLVFNNVYGMLNQPVDGGSGDETPLQAAGQGTAADMETVLSDLTNTGQFSQFIANLQGAE